MTISEQLFAYIKPPKNIQNINEINNVHSNLIEPKIS
jgi:hypothetical protein